MQRCEEFRQLYLKIYHREHGFLCQLSESELPRGHFLLLGYPSNTNVMRSNWGELVALRNVLEEGLISGSRFKVTIMISQRDGFTSNMERLSEFLSYYKNLHLHVFVYHSEGRYEEFRGDVLRQETQDINDSQKTRISAVAAARNAVLYMSAAGFNKEM